MRILVVGGAGYIGSVTARALGEAGHETTILDNLSTGHRELAEATKAELVVGELGDEGLVTELLERRRIEAVMHFAAHSLVGESVAEPRKYWENNLAATLTLLRAMREARAGFFIFSSTAAVYGEPERTPIDEEHPCAPINPYGRSKLAVEWVLADYAGAYGLRAASLRYFNAAGATRDAVLGELHSPETHLIPNVLRAALGGPPLSVFGSDYPTTDGTCVRDYIHVQDLAAAHILALIALAERPRGTFLACNLGNGRGFSVREIIAAAERVTGKEVPVEEAARREGDPPVLVASSEQARAELGWRPVFGAVDKIIETAWRFHSARGFGE